MAEPAPTTVEQPLSPAPQRQPVIDLRTGLMTRPWVHWLDTSWRRQGGPHAPANDELGTSLATTQAELDATQADLAATQAALAATQAELDATQAELAATQAELDQTQLDLAATQAAQAQTQADLDAFEAQHASDLPLGTALTVARFQSDGQGVESAPVIIDAAGNLRFVGAAGGTNLAVGVVLPNGIAPTAGHPTNAIQLWAANRGGVDDKSGLHLRTEDGTSHVFGDRVGIGTLTPQAALEVVGALAVSDTVGIGAPPSPVAPLGFGTALGAKVFLYESGNSRYGLTMSSGALEVHSASGGRVDVGGLSTADGTTFTPHLSVMGATGNVGLGTQTFGTSAAKVLAVANGTAPTTSPADAVQVWSADVDGVAGQAGLHVRSEGGVLHRLGSGFLTRRLVQIVTTATVAAPLVLTADDSHRVLVSNNATELAQFTLPSAVAGLTYTIVVNVVQGVRLRAAAGDLFRLGATSSPAAGQMQSTTAGDYAVLVAINATIWQVLSPVQGWTVGA